MGATQSEEKQREYLIRTATAKQQQQQQSSSLVVRTCTTRHCSQLFKSSRGQTAVSVDSHTPERRISAAEHKEPDSPIDDTPITLARVITRQPTVTAIQESPPSAAARDPNYIPIPDHHIMSASYIYTPATIKPRLYYFASRGRAELIRLILADAGIEYEGVYVGAWHPVEKTPAFQALIDAGILPFDQLPLWEEPGGFILAQSSAIIAYIAQLYGLSGVSMSHSALARSYYDAICDIEKEMIDAKRIYVDEYDALMHIVDVILPKWCTYLERAAAKNSSNGWLVGMDLTYADIALFYFLETLFDQRIITEEWMQTRFPHTHHIYTIVSTRPGILRHRNSQQRFPIQPLFSIDPANPQRVYMETSDEPINEHVVDGQRNEDGHVKDKVKANGHENGVSNGTNGHQDANATPEGVSAEGVKA